MVVKGAANDPKQAISAYERLTLILLMIIPGQMINNEIDNFTTYTIVFTLVTL